MSITGGTTQATGYSYNHRGELSDVKDAATGEDWSRGYNLLGQVTSTTDPNSGAVALCHLRARRRMTEMLRRFR